MYLKTSGSRSKKYSFLFESKKRSRVVLPNSVSEKEIEKKKYLNKVDRLADRLADAATRCY